MSIENRVKSRNINEKAIAPIGASHTLSVGKNFSQVLSIRNSVIPANIDIFHFSASPTVIFIFCLL